MQVMTRAEQLQTEYDGLIDKQCTVIKDRDALKQVWSDSVLIVHVFYNLQQSCVDKEHFCHTSFLLQVIEELDGIRKQTLESTWKKVTGMFSDIFKTLLPGTEACLQPSGGPNGDFLEGLEVRVAFGGVWKESLSELSGGQRSLLSLSLILALLKLQPAPVYILDEVCSTTSECSNLDNFALCDRSTGGVSMCTLPTDLRLTSRGPDVCLSNHKLPIQLITT